MPRTPSGVRLDAASSRVLVRDANGHLHGCDDHGACAELKPKAN